MKHVHHWRVESPYPNQQQLQAHCIKCGGRRTFPANPAEVANPRGVVALIGRHQRKAVRA